MKTFKTYSLLIAILSISLFSCDVIEEPFTEEIIVEECTQKCRKILLEDYTGHKCGNCPRAAEKVQELQEIFGEYIVPIAVHAGWFAIPSPSGEKYRTDFRTGTGEIWDTHFGNSLAGNPNGMINRINYPAVDHIYQHSVWAQKIQELLTTEPDVYIEITPTYTALDNSISVLTETEILKELNASLNITVVLTESHILDYQTDYNLDEVDVSNYEHNHVLRASLTGAWGLDLGKEVYAINDKINKSLSIELDSSWVVANLSVIAFVSNTNTFEVLQAEEIHLTE